MRAPRIIPCLLLPAVLILAGCGYIHVGRMPVPPATIVGDEQLMSENAGLRLERKMLQQELALTRAQGEALRMAIENRAADGDTSKQLVARLNETTRELATLRATYAKLQSDRDHAFASSNEAIALKARLGATEERLAASLRTYTELQEEITRLRADVVRTRYENAVLSAEVKNITAKNEHAQAALAQLNTQLLAQKEARHQAEHDAEAFRAELKTVAPNSSLLAQERTGTAAGARSLVAEHAAEAAALKRQLDLLRAQVDRLAAERAKASPHPAAVSVAPDQFSGMYRVGTAAKPPAGGDATHVAERPAGAPLVVVEASRIDLGTDATPPPSSGSSAAGVVKGGSSVSATLVTSVGPDGRGMAATSDAGSPRFHLVTGGDTLARISTLYYGTPARWGDILAANREVMGEDSKLVVGRTLRIP
jgi:nucleoid-associated protein YgaU